MSAPDKQAMAFSTALGERWSETVSRQCKQPRLKFAPASLNSRLSESLCQSGTLLRRAEHCFKEIASACSRRLICCSRLLKPTHGSKSLCRYEETNKKTGQKDCAHLSLSVCFVCAVLPSLLKSKSASGAKLDCHFLCPTRTTKSLTFKPLFALTKGQLFSNERKDKQKYEICKCKKYVNRLTCFNLSTVNCLLL